MTTSSSPTAVSLTTTDGALHLWRGIVRSLQMAGYAKVVPEYLKLSRLLSQTRMAELLKGQPDAEHWNELRALAGEALQCLGPLVDAAKILAELPAELRITMAGSIAQIAPAEPEGIPETVLARPAPKSADSPESKASAPKRPSKPKSPANVRRRIAN